MSKGGFFERWSRRKLGAGEAEEAVHSLDESQVPGADTPEEEELDEAELARLPSLESFTIETDLAPFLRKGVPHALRNAAMRKMWMLDPAIRDHKDLAVDYAWDWNTPGGVPGNSGTISRDSVARMLESLNPKLEETATAQPDPAEGNPDAGDSLATAAPEVRPQLQEPPDRGVSDAPDSTPAGNGPAGNGPAGNGPAGNDMSRPGVKRRLHGGSAPV